MPILSPLMNCDKLRRGSSIPSLHLLRKTQQSTSVCGLQPSSLPQVARGLNGELDTFTSFSMTKGIAAPLGDCRSRKEYGTIGYARNDGGFGFWHICCRKVLPYILTFVKSISFFIRRTQACGLSHSPEWTNTLTLTLTRSVERTFRLNAESISLRLKGN